MKYRKIYGTNHSCLSTVINVCGEQKRIEFTGGVPVGASRVSARFNTSNESIQQAIESDDRYGKLFFLEAIYPIKEAERVEKKGKMKEYKFITRVQDAINVLATEYEVPLDEIKSKSDVLAVSKIKNVSFPNMR